MKDWHVILILAILAYIFVFRSKNSEVWEWTDYRGFTYRIQVGRDVH